MPTLDEIRRDKYSKIVEKFKEKEKQKTLKKTEEEKIFFIFQRIMEKDAFEYFNDLKYSDFQTYINIGLNLINNFNLVPPFIDLIIDDLLKGRKPRKISKIEIMKMERKIKNVESQIKIIRDGESKDLSEVLHQKTPKESPRDDQGGTAGED